MHPGKATLANFGAFLWNGLRAAQGVGSTDRLLKYGFFTGRKLEKREK